MAGISFTPQRACCVSSTMLGRGHRNGPGERRRGMQKSQEDLAVPWP